MTVRSIRDNFQEIGTDLSNTSTHFLWPNDDLEDSLQDLLLLIEQCCLWIRSYVQRDPKKHYERTLEEQLKQSFCEPHWKPNLRSSGKHLLLLIHISKRLKKQRWIACKVQTRSCLECSSSNALSQSCPICKKCSWIDSIFDDIPQEKAQIRSVGQSMLKWAMKQFIRYYLRGNMRCCTILLQPHILESFGF